MYENRRHMLEAVLLSCSASGPSNLLGVVAPIFPGVTRGFCQGKFALLIYLCVYGLALFTQELWS